MEYYVNGTPAERKILEKKYALVYGRSKCGPVRNVLHMTVSLNVSFLEAQATELENGGRLFVCCVLSLG